MPLSTPHDAGVTTLASPSAYVRTSGIMLHLPGSAQSLAGEFGSLTAAGESIPTALDCREQVNCSGDHGDDRHCLQGRSTGWLSPFGYHHPGRHRAAGCSAPLSSWALRRRNAIDQALVDEFEDHGSEGGRDDGGGSRLFSRSGVPRLAPVMDPDRTAVIDQQSDLWRSAQIRLTSGSARRRG